MTTTATGGEGTPVDPPDATAEPRPGGAASTTGDGTAGPRGPAQDPAAMRRRLGLHWWREVLYIIGFYLLYTEVRNTFGSAGTGGRAVANAYDHARDVIHLEKALHLWIEPGLQRWYLGLPAHGFISLWNNYYAIAHFVVTIVALIALFVRAPWRYQRWRNTLAIMTAAALIGFASFSLMPPRLLGENQNPYGACYQRQADCHGYDFVDTLERYGGLWNFDSGAVAKVSNQYAAMPSLHTGWSTWCAFVLIPMTRRKWLKALIALYPAATVFCIMVTANHYWVDAAGGLVVFGVGYGLGSWLAARLGEWRERRLRSAGTDGPGGGNEISAAPT